MLGACTCFMIGSDFDATSIVLKNFTPDTRFGMISLEAILLNSVQEIHN